MNNDNEYKNTFEFDDIYKTDTTFHVLKHQFIYKPENFDDGTHYMPSWTNEITSSHKVVLEYLKESFSDFVFIDLGSGKGKTILQWLISNKENNVSQEVIGIEYYAPLWKTSKKNYELIFKSKDHPFVNLDVLDFDFNNYNKLILYFYNPFDYEIFGKILDIVATKETIIINNNPQYPFLFSKRGFNLINTIDEKDIRNKIDIYSNFK